MSLLHYRNGILRSPTPEEANNEELREMVRELQDAVNGFKMIQVIMLERLEHLETQVSVARYQPKSGDSSTQQTLPPLIEEAQSAFWRDLPRLLKERPGQWVAYRGGSQIGFAATDITLYRQCLRLGLNDEEFLVRCIEPEVDAMIVGPRCEEQLRARTRPPLQ